MDNFSNIESGKGILKQNYDENSDALGEALKRKRKKSFDNFKTINQDPIKEDSNGSSLEYN